MLSPMILANAIYTVVDAFTSENNAVMSYIIGDAGAITPNALQAAQSWLYFLVVAIILLIVTGICSLFVFYQRRNDD